MADNSSPQACLLLAAAIALATALPTRSQELVDASTSGGYAFIQQFEKDLAASEEQSSRLACSIRPLKPVLNFTFRYQAGYRVNIPIEQFPPRETALRIRFRVTASGHEDAFYFSDEGSVPAQPRSRRATVLIGGGFFLGEGVYQVEWLLGDDDGRSCRKRWRIKQRLKGNERKLIQFVEPGNIKPLVLDDWKGTSAGPPRPYRIAVVLHASPLFPRSARLSLFDRSLLVATLTSLFEETPFRETCVYALSLQHQREIFHSGEMDVLSFLRLQEAMEELELGTIDLEQLSNPRGHVDLLEELVNRELASENPPDAFVFIGPNTRYTARFARTLRNPASGRKPLFFYLHLDYYARRFPSADTIEKLVKLQPGKVFDIHFPKQFAKAILKMEEMLKEARAGQSMIRR